MKNFYPFYINNNLLISDNYMAWGQIKSAPQQRNLTDDSCYIYRSYQLPSVHILVRRNPPFLLPVN